MISNKISSWNYLSYHTCIILYALRLYYSDGVTHLSICISQAQYFTSTKIVTVIILYMYTCMQAINCKISTELNPTSSYSPNRLIHSPIYIMLLSMLYIYTFIYLHGSFGHTFHSPIVSGLHCIYTCVYTV